MKSFSLFAIFVSLFICSLCETQQEAIDRINNDPNIPWTAGVNEFFGKERLGNRPWLLNRRHPGFPLSGMNLETRNELPKSTFLPENFDSRTNWPQCPTIGHILNQGNCGSCYLFGGVQPLTDRFCIQTNGEFDEQLSIQHMLNCDFLDGQCGGGDQENVWDYFRFFGTTTEACTGPYKGKAEACNFDKCQDGSDAKKYYSKNPYTVGPDQQYIQYEIMTNGPVESCFLVYADFDLYKGGVYVPSVQKKGDGGHCVKMIGWGFDEESQLPYWRCVNSWGDQWGENGTFRILRGSNACDIESEIACGEPDVDHEPIPAPTDKPVGNKAVTQTIAHYWNVYVMNMDVVEHLTDTYYYNSDAKMIRIDSCGGGSGLLSDIKNLQTVPVDLQLSGALTVGNSKICPIVIKNYNSMKQYSIKKYFGDYYCTVESLEGSFPNPEQLIPEKSEFVNYTISNGAITALWQYSYTDADKSTHVDYYYTSTENIANHNNRVTLYTFNKNSMFTSGVRVQEEQFVLTERQDVDDKVFDLGGFNCPV
ncbi:tubulointerstitial nephritis antigen-like [Anaeramoeba flamelloides]|uniref:Tubulointerstitial nephritis antigen-like n=1 Tax=Anaeramoeba flamelloides TaxID=1746091 RepID=A0ABQ8XXC1_9EUKA|nr:tubulointerstitial nephritis antigen-like [Anaeramoeba flamelloides]